LRLPCGPNSLERARGWLKLALEFDWTIIETPQFGYIEIQAIRRDETFFALRGGWTSQTKA
jgi:hypothetical protein